MAEQKVQAPPVPTKPPTPAQLALRRLIRIYLYSLGVGIATFLMGNLGVIMDLLKNFQGLKAWVIVTAVGAMGGPIIEATLKFFRARLAEEQKAQDQAEAK